MKAEKISTQDAQKAIRDANFVLTRDHLRSRIVNTANMINSYWREYQDYLVEVMPDIQRIETHNLADVAIKMYQKPLQYWERPHENRYEYELGVLERRLKVLNRISMEMQELRVCLVVNKNVDAH